MGDPLLQNEQKKGVKQIMVIQYYAENKSMLKEVLKNLLRFNYKEIMDQYGESERNDDCNPKSPNQV